MQAKLLAALLALTAVPAYAQTNEPVRYQLISVAGGFVRLDTVSGVMTFCRDEVDSFRCSPISTDVASTEKEPGAGAVPKHDEDAMSGDRDGDSSEMKREPGFKGDSSVEDFDRALTMMEKAMRSFMAMSKENPKDCAL